MHLPANFLRRIFVKSHLAISGPAIQGKAHLRVAQKLAIVLRAREFLICCDCVAMHPSSFPRDSATPGSDARSRSAADEELVQQMRSGNEGAFAIFYDRLAPGLFSMIHEILRDQKESEDVLQGAFLQMWKHTTNYDPARSSLFTWAVMISRHKAIDQLRSRQRQSRLGEARATESAAFSASAPADRADNALARTNERERVRAALAQLGEGQREAIELAFFGGLTQSEISEWLSAPLGPVKARIRRGLLTLRELLEELSS
jgi:RNA polymerase sigma-70 factor, ECF subfamily